MNTFQLQKNIQYIQESNTMKQILKFLSHNYRERKKTNSINYKDTIEIKRKTKRGLEVTGVALIIL